MKTVETKTNDGNFEIIYSASRNGVVVSVRRLKFEFGESSNPVCESFTWDQYEEISPVVEFVGDAERQLAGMYRV